MMKLRRDELGIGEIPAHGCRLGRDRSPPRNSQGRLGLRRLLMKCRDTGMSSTSKNAEGQVVPWRVDDGVGLEGDGNCLAKDKAEEDDETR